MTLLLLFTLLPLSACAPHPAPPAAVESAGPSAGPPAPSDDGTAPRPFTAEQIRDNHPDGTVVTLRVEGATDPPVVMVWTFTGGTATEATIATKIFGADGGLLQDAGAETSRWTELREHAAFPAAATQRTEEVVTVPAGRFDCWRYHVVEGGETSDYWFAKAEPGPPVQMEVHGSDGHLVRRMSLLSRTEPGS